MKKLMKIFMVFALMATVVACGNDDDLDIPNLPGVVKVSYLLKIDGKEVAKGTLSMGTVIKDGDLINVAAFDGDMQKEQVNFGVSVVGISPNLGITTNVNGDDIAVGFVKLNFKGEEQTLYSTEGTITRETKTKVSFKCKGQMTGDAQKVYDFSGYIISEGLKNPVDTGVEM